MRTIARRPIFHQTEDVVNYETTLFVVNLENVPGPIIRRMQTCIQSLSGGYNVEYVMNIRGIIHWAMVNISRIASAQI